MSRLAKKMSCCLPPLFSKRILSSSGFKGVASQAKRNEIISPAHGISHLQVKLTPATSGQLDAHRLVEVIQPIEVDHRITFALLYEDILAIPFPCKRETERGLLHPERPSSNGTEVNGSSFLPSPTCPYAVENVNPPTPSDADPLRHYSGVQRSGRNRQDASVSHPAGTPSLRNYPR